MSSVCPNGVIHKPVSGFRSLALSSEMIRPADTWERLHSARVPVPCSTHGTPPPELGLTLRPHTSAAQSNPVFDVRSDMSWCLKPGTERQGFLLCSQLREARGSKADQGTWQMEDLAGRTGPLLPGQRVSWVSHIPPLRLNFLLSALRG